MLRSLIALLICSAATLAADAPSYKLPPLRLEAVSLPAATGESQDWGIANLNGNEAWKKSKGKDVVIAVLDTGWASNHRDLKGQVLEAKDFTNSRYGPEDRHGHGTWCAACIAAAENDWGMIGHAPHAKLLILKVLGDDGSGSVVGIRDAIRYAADWKGPNGEVVSVISASLGGSSTDSYIPPAIDYAASKGIIFVAAAGNDGPRENSIGYPGGYKNVIAVAAHDVNSKTASFSSRGARVLVSGPGVNTRAAIPGAGDGLFGTMSGTSMACPAVAGQIGNAIAAGALGPRDSGRQARAEALIAKCCVDMNAPGRDTASGFGRLDAAKLVADGTPPPPPVDPPAPGVDVVKFEPADLKTFEGFRKLLALAASDKTVKIEVTVPK